MNPQLRQLQEWFRGLAPRERAMVAVCAVFVAVTLLYLGLWQPLSHARAQREQALITSRALGDRLEQIAAEVQKAGASGEGAVNRNLSLLTAVDQSSKAAGALSKPLSRIQPDGDTTVKVWADGVSFDSLLHWLSDLQTHYGIAVESADIERTDTPGQVNARLSLVRP